MDPKNQRTYTGRSGQMAVMAELLSLGCNVAIPEIDVGEDVFAFQDGQRTVDRIQVKTANAKRLKDPQRYTADVSVPLKQLKTIDGLELYYVFAVRLDGAWTDFIVISRDELNTLHENDGVGRKNYTAGELQLHLIFAPKGALECSGENLTGFRNIWKHLPVVAMSAVVEEATEQAKDPESAPSPTAPQG